MIVVVHTDTVPSTDEDEVIDFMVSMGADTVEIVRASAIGTDVRFTGDDDLADEVRRAIDNWNENELV